jgi:hypothetical protein
VVRTRLGQRAQPAARSQPPRLPPHEPRGSVQVRERASRRAVTPPVDAGEADARAHQGAAHGGDWDNPQGAGALWPSARLGRGRRRPRLETTHVEGA